MSCHPLIILLLIQFYIYSFVYLQLKKALLGDEASCSENKCTTCITLKNHSPFYHDLEEVTACMVTGHDKNEIGNEIVYYRQK